MPGHRCGIMHMPVLLCTRCIHAACAMFCTSFRFCATSALCISYDQNVHPPCTITECSVDIRTGFLTPDSKSPHKALFCRPWRMGRALTNAAAPAAVAVLAASGLPCRRPRCCSSPRPGVLPGAAARQLLCQRIPQHRPQVVGMQCQAAMGPMSQRPSQYKLW